MGFDLFHAQFSGLEMLNCLIVLLGGITQAILCQRQAARLHGQQARLQVRTGLGIVNCLAVQVVGPFQIALSERQAGQGEGNVEAQKAVLDALGNIPGLPEHFLGVFDGQEIGI